MLQTPYYLLDKSKLLINMERIKKLSDLSGAKALLALKCFASWGVFDMMRQYMAGTTSSSLYELRLGAQEFGGETHGYSVAWADHEITQAIGYCDKLIFNSASQLNRFSDATQNIARGLRINPQISSSDFDLADPARPFSRLGELDKENIKASLDLISGFMIHNNCENHDFARFDQMLHHIEQEFGDLFHQVEWVSLGGGIAFTAENYPLEALAKRLRQFAERYSIQLYLEPGEAAVSHSATLEVSVLDILHNGKRLAIVDSSIEAHMLDLLVYRESAKILPNQGNYEYMICGKSCLAGDVFGSYRFSQPLEVGSKISIENAAAYTIVKKNWFNGVTMPNIVIKELDGSFKIQREFGYEDYKASLS
ncbi:carboxynorspermidine decarboxylase [Bartonella sp. TP]|uniref:carboxynorspermidine decarboxylase n=1 Tax=Bartonella sp. TP TaxID=3057550 RepID=UPI0025B14730|nr:carboxynorspermidine decarboxylase [Bartonella sp. TP]MDN5248652.1 carboxynorspermidine decarboxylase [Alphaproteobacteria bacterium]WJW79509.1 carboxynorspermidine decarboxylase [Bartonella sp. TP]